MLWAASGCRTWPRMYNTGISPIYPPEFVDARDTPVINTSHPELKWKDIRIAGDTYDICVWESSTAAAHLDNSSDGSNARWGTVVYVADHLSANFHQVTEPLKPDKTYDWSVRIRSANGKVGQWSSFSQESTNFFYIESSMRWVVNEPFVFKTAHDLDAAPPARSR